MEINYEFFKDVFISLLDNELSIYPTSFLEQMHFHSYKSKFCFSHLNFISFYCKLVLNQFNNLRRVEGIHQSMF